MLCEYTWTLRVIALFLILFAAMDFIGARNGFLKGQTEGQWNQGAVKKAWSPPPMERIARGSVILLIAGHLIKKSFDDE